MRKIKTRIAIGLAAMAFATAPALAQDKPADFPRRPIELVVVYPAGGGMDVTARILAKNAERVLGHQFRVVNKTGGGGRVGHMFIGKQAKPDGYTLGVLSMGAQFTHILEDSSQFATTDFDPLVHIAYEPYIYMTRGESLEELLERAKAEPGKVRIGVVSGSTSDLIMGVVQEEAGVEFAQVPFQGGAPRLLGLVNGTIDVAPMFFTEGEQYDETGEAKFVAVADTARHQSLPDVPTMPELGIDMPGGVFGAVRYVALPAGVPEDRRAYLAAAFKQVLEDPTTQAEFKEVGVTVSYMGPDDTKAMYDEAFSTIEKLTSDSASTVNN